MSSKHRLFGRWSSEANHLKNFPSHSSSVKYRDILQLLNYKLDCAQCVINTCGCALLNPMQISNVTSRSICDMNERDIETHS